MRMETPLSRVRGLGPAGHGGGDWWAVRLNSMALLLLSVWLLVSLLRLPDLAYGTLAEWLRGPITATLMLLLVATTFWHIRKGLREVIDDYAHVEGNRVGLITLLDFFVYGGGTLAAVCVLKIALGAGVS
jgi:succinate dehydrogenase / fumarate reductase membrane anchor subunit